MRSKSVRLSAVLAAGVWSVALLIFLFPPSPIVTQAPPVKQIIGVQDYLMCPGLVSPGSYSPALRNFPMLVNSDFLVQSFPPKSEWTSYGNICLAPGGSVTVANTGQTPMRVDDYTGYGGNGSSPILAHGQSVTLYPAHSGYIVFTPLVFPGSLTAYPEGVVGVVLAQPTALPPGLNA